MEEKLFGYLKDILYNPEKAHIDETSLPDSHQNLVLGLQYLHKCIIEQRIFVKGLSKGDMSVLLPASDNPITGDLRSLHSSVSHLIWQANQVAKGDFSQQLDFMGELSDVFNLMTQQLEERENRLIRDMKIVQEKNHMLKQSQDLLVTLTDNLLDLVCVLDYHGKICYANKSFNMVLDSATEEAIETLIGNLVSAKTITNDDDNNKLELSLSDSDICFMGQYFTANIHGMNWNNLPSSLCILKNITKERESYIFSLQDSLTGLFNRRFGMNYIQSCLAKGIDFQIAFIDLDLLKCVNDVYGHNIGDQYIISAANYLLSLPQPNTVVRLGGDEFLVITHYDEPMTTHLELMRKTFIIESKGYLRSFSYGVANSIEDGKDIARLLELADERMYAYKLANKKNRR